MGTAPVSGEQLRRQLNRELAASSKRLGQKLDWSWHERQIIDAACRVADRLVSLHAGFEAARLDLSAAAATRVSAELRALEAQLAGLLGRLSFEPDKAKPKSVRHQRAAYARWGRSEAGAVIDLGTDYRAL